MATQIERPSLTTSLEDRYKKSDKNVVPPAGNFVDQSNTFSNNFTENAAQGVTQLTDKALHYADSLGVSRKKYKG
jgi:hypothetical protein